MLSTGNINRDINNQLCLKKLAIYVDKANKKKLCPQNRQEIQADKSKDVQGHIECCAGTKDCWHFPVSLYTNIYVYNVAENNVKLQN